MPQVEGFSHRISIVQRPDCYRLGDRPVAPIAMGKGQGVLIACCPRIGIHRHRGGITIGHRNGDISTRVGI